MNLSISDIRGLWTQALIDVYSTKTTATSFLRGFFPVEISDTLNVSIQVRRGTNKVAVDVHRGGEGNLNAASYSSEKQIQPPMYDEGVIASELDFYDRAFGTLSAKPEEQSKYIQELAEELVHCQDKIDRATELQCAEVLEFGTVTLKSAAKILYGRKAGSMVDDSANTWATGTNDPAAILKQGAEFIKKNAKVNTHTFNVIMGDDAFDAMINNATFQNKSDLKDVDLNQINMPVSQKEQVGATFMGVTSAGSYKFRVWTYSQFYDLAGTQTKYINPKKIIILPESPRFKTAYGAVPHLRTDPKTGAAISIANTAGQYHVSDDIDTLRKAHIFTVTAAPVAIPVGVDEMFTAQVLV